MNCHTVRTTLLCLAMTPLGLLGQEIHIPTAEEYAEDADKAENLPLFQSQEPLRMTLRTDIKWLRDERNDSVEVEGTLTFIDVDGSEVVKPVDTRARGNFRRDKKNCNFPPLRLDFPTGQMEGTVFEGQDKVKLVTPCRDNSDDYQRYIFNEYLAYRVLNTLTEVSFRVRLVEITYEDVNEDYDTRTKFGFLIEDEDDMAARNRAVLEDVTQFHPMRTLPEYSVLAAMFNYMIGNTDWSPVYFHNVKLIRTEEAQFMTVPYDFDSSGIVNARYATVDPSLHDKIRRVRQRLYRGFCREELTHALATAPFAAARDDINSLFTDFAAIGHEQYEPDDAEDRIEWFEDFFRVVDEEDRFEREILRECRDMDPGQ
jgi:hypothetical protein